MSGINSLQCPREYQRAVDKKLKDLSNYSTPKDVEFILTEYDDGIECNLNTLKLHSYLYTSNMVLFTEKDQLKKYETIDEINSKFENVFEKLLIILILCLEATSAISLNSPKKFSKEHS